MVGKLGEAGDVKLGLLGGDMEAFDNGVDEDDDGVCGVDTPLRIKGDEVDEVEEVEEILDEIEEIEEVLDEVEEVDEIEEVEVEEILDEIPEEIVDDVSIDCNGKCKPAVILA